ncbi:hypothetical protein F4814DRAFT_411434 [Daldinia grandis]|nr:hypothetical protein F4814DRAFT_411434 [Daldinia grandis]
MARWPSWLWREVKVTLIPTSSWSNPRGFKSHSCHIFTFYLCAVRIHCLRRGRNGICFANFDGLGVDISYQLRITYLTYGVYRNRHGGKGARGE